MSSTAGDGGAVGDIRASIDEKRFGDYIAVNVSEILVPVQIKQFQARMVSGFGFGLRRLT